MARDLNFTIPFFSREDLIKKYLKILYKFHKLTDKEIEITTEIVSTYSDLFKQHGREIADRLIFDTETKKVIRKKLDISDPIFQNYLSALRKKKVIKGKTLAPQYVPPIEDFKLVFNFNGQTSK